MNMDYSLLIIVHSGSKMASIRLWWWTWNNCTKVNFAYFNLLTRLKIEDNSLAKKI